MLGLVRRCKTLRSIGDSLDKHYAAICVFYLFSISCIQLVIIHETYFTTGWDVRVLIECATDPESHTDYLSQYPNQIALFAIFRLVYGLCASAGIDDFYLVLDIIGALSISIGVMLASCAIRKIAGVWVGVFTLVFGGILAAMSPWIAVPYSDTYAALFPAAAFFSYVCIKRPSPRYFFTTLFSALGYLIKPTTVFALVSIALVEGVTQLSNKSSRKCPDMGGRRFKPSVSKACCCLISIAAAAAIAFAAKAGCSSLTPALNEEASFTSAHYLMMGFNTEVKGVYSESDVAYSASFSTKRERNSADYARWLQRVNEMGIDGVAKLMLEKTLTNYGDGTFAWAREGTFFADTPKADTALAKYFGQDDRPWTAFQMSADFIWFFVLIGICLNWARRPCNTAEYVLMCALMCLSVFLMLFEARARYLFLYVPLFVAWSGMGWQELSRIFEGRRNNAKGRHFPCRRFG